MSKLFSTANLPATLSRQAFEKQITALNESLRRQIEVEVEGFKGGFDAKAKRLEQVFDAKNGFRFFVETYFPHYISLKPNRLHLHLFEVLPDLLRKKNTGEKGKKLAFIAPRGSAKSTLVSQLFTLYAILTGRKHYILIIMDAYEQAALMLEAIKIELEDNPRLKNDFSEIVGAGHVWREGNIVTRNHIRIEGLGSRQKVRGRRHGAYRPDLVILDDIENDENVRSPDYRDKTESWVLKAVEPLSPPDGSMDLMILGTLLHFDAVLARISSRHDYIKTSFKSIETMPERMDLWDAFNELAVNGFEAEARAKYHLNKDKMDQGAVLFWPEVKPLVDLMYKRALSPDSFQSEDQNEPFADNSPFKEIVFWTRQEPDLVKFGAIDPSLGKRGKGDPSAILIGGIDRKTGRMDILEASIRKRLPDVIIENTLELQKQYQCALWFVETVQFQEFLQTELAKRAVLAGLNLPTIPVVPNVDKALRIEGLQSPIKMGLFAFTLHKRPCLTNCANGHPARMMTAPIVLPCCGSLVCTMGKAFYRLKPSARCHARI